MKMHFVLAALIGVLALGGALAAQPATSGFVTLSLEPAAAVSGEPVPPDMPAGKVSVSLPLYPGAMPTDQPFQQPFEMTPASPYLKAARARYVVPGTPATVEAWYRQKLPASGFPESGSGSTGGRGVVAATGVDFVSQQDSSLHVILSFQEGHGGTTLLQYWVTDVAVPARPAESGLPADTVRVEISYRPWQPQSPMMTRTITDPATVGRLVQLINGLQRDNRGVHGCLEDHGQGAVMTFLATSGASKSVEFRPACSSVRVGDVALYDKQLNVWNAVVAAVGDQAQQ
ncbi:MAG: hypothetical protein JWN15_483 [Firmicutes bacterium]|nr:hypothetical protein [Bacillota bacterium]